MSAFTWLASYPKSGNTWLRLLLETVRRPGAVLDINSLSVTQGQLGARAIADAVLGVDTCDLTCEELQDIRLPYLRELARRPHLCGVYKAHECWRAEVSGADMFLESLTLGSVYLVRDPRDVAVSLAHHLDIDIDAAIRCMRDRDHVLGAGVRRFRPLHPTLIGSWSWNVRSWLELARPAPLRVRYEDLCADPGRELRRVVDHLQWVADDEAIAAAIAATRFDRLQAAEQRHGFAEGPRGRVFFRRGQAGSWRHELSSAQARSVEDDHGDMMSALGYLG